MRNRVVSVITPCYNGEMYIFRLLDSILNQSYPNIEMIVVDDGSTDNSAKIIKSYIPRFEIKGYSLKYIYQENQGQSVAINNALKLFCGDYLVWPDSDDFYATNVAISEMVSNLENSDDSISVVRCYSNVLDEVTLQRISVNDSYGNKSDLFEDCLFVQNDFWFGAGNYMAKSSYLKIAIPTLNIYTAKNAGQNWQILLPLLYRKQCRTIPNQLYSILARASSHSRGKYTSLEQLILKYEAYENSIINTLENMQIPQCEKIQYIDKIKHSYQVLRLSAYINFRHKSEALRLKKYILEYNGSINFRLAILFSIMFLPFSKSVLNFTKWLRRFLS